MAAYNADCDAVVDALAVGDIDQARSLLTEGASLDIQKAAQVMISSGQCEALKFLIREYKLDVDKYCCLHLALLAGQENIAKLLVDSGADVNKLWNVESEKGIGIPWQEYVEMLRRIHSGKCEIIDHYPLGLAVHSSVDMMRFLIQSGADVNVGARSQMRRYGQPALHMAVNTGNVEKIKLLIDHGVDIEAKTGKYETALIYACDNPIVSSDCVQVLLENGANPNSRAGNGFNISRAAIHFAVESGNIQKVKLLIQYGVQLEARTYDGDTALILACQESVPADCVRILLENGAFPNVKNKNRQIPLTLATATVDHKKINLLKQYGATEEERTHQEETAIMSACQRNGDVETFRHLLENNSSPNLRNRRGETALHRAVLAGDTQKLQVLFQYNSDVNAMDDNGVTPLMKACKEVSVGVDCVRFLLENKASPNLTDIGGETAVHFAARARNERKVQLLLQHGADINVVGEDNKTLLMRACAEDSVTVDYVRFLLANNALPNLSNIRGETAISLSAGAGNAEKLELLLQHGADVNAVDEDGKTPLMLACTEDTNCVLSLLEKGAFPNLIDKDKNTAFDFAVRAGCVERARLLIDYGANVDYNTKYLNAAHENDREFLTFFSETGADISAEDSLGQNAIMLAVRGSLKYGNSAVVQWLMDKGVSVNQRDKNGWTPLKVAAYYGNTEIVKVLIKAGAAVDAMTAVENDRHGKEIPVVSLYIVNNRMCKCGCEELLIRAGAINTSRNRWNNILHLMVTNDNCKMVGLLLTHGMVPRWCSLSHVDVDMFDPISPLTLALKLETFPLIRYLIDNMALCPCDVDGYLYSGKFRAHLEKHNRTDIISFMDEFYSQPKSLLQLCCVTIYYTMDEMPGRLGRINSLPLPEPLKKQLSFKNCYIPYDFISEQHWHPGFGSRFM